MIVLRAPFYLAFQEELGGCMASSRQKKYRKQFVFGEYWNAFFFEGETKPWCNEFKFIIELLDCWCFAYFYVKILPNWGGWLNVLEVVERLCHNMSTVAT